MTATTTHVVALATMFPDASRPNFSIFVERSMAALAAQPGIALSVIAPVGVPPWPLSLHPRYRALAQLPEHEIWNGITVYRPRFTLIPGVARRNALAVARAAMPVAAMLAASGRADVIQAQFFWPDGPAAVAIASALNIPSSVKARGSDISLWAKRSDVGPMVIDAAHRATAILSVSRALREDMIALGMDADRITVHYTGLDAERFRPLDRSATRREWDIPDNATMLLTVGALTARKGQALVIDALRTLPENVIYCMAGTGEDAAALSAQATDAGLEQRVRQLGVVNNAQLPALYAAADVMVLASASEGLANAWVEALGCGVPLVLGDIAPAHELVDADDVGRIAAREPESIAGAVRSLLASPPDRDALSARTHARFSWDRHGEQLAEHLRGLAQGQSADR